MQTYLPQPHHLLYKAISVCGVIDLEFWVFPWIYDSPFFAAEIVPAYDGCTLLPGPDEQLLLAQSYRRRRREMRSDEHRLGLCLVRCSVWWTYFLFCFLLKRMLSFYQIMLCYSDFSHVWIKSLHIMLYHYWQHNLESATFQKAWTQTEV